MLRYLALFALLLATPAAAQDHFFPTPGNAIVPGYVTMCLNGSNQAIPCAAGGGLAAGAAVTGCAAQTSLFITSTLTLGCVAALSESDAGLLLLPDTTAACATGVIQFGGARFIHDTNATSNTFVGHNSANCTTTTTNTVAIGESAGLALAAGGSNTFVGRFAGGGVTGGTGNVAVGTSSLATGANSGSSNTAVGNGALSGTGSNNTGIGVTTGGDLTNGGSNTFIGQNTGRGILTGSNNTVIGAGVTGLSSALASAVILSAGAGAIKADFGNTTASTWTFFGALAATLNTAVGTNVVCNTPGTTTAITVQVSATGCAASSARFKEGIASIDKDQALRDVLRFQPVSYFYKPEFNMGSDKHVGFTAEQIGGVDPQWITYESDGVTPHAVKYNEMAPLFAAAIQALKADNDNLRAELEDLKRRVH